MPQKYMVIVTYGSRPNHVYAQKIRHLADAKALVAAANRRGYMDAKIEDAQDFEEARQARLANRPAA